MKIAIVTSSFPLRADDAAAAAGLFVRDFAVALAELGHSVHVVTQDKGYGCRDEPPGVSVTCYPWPGGERPLSQLKMTRPRDALAGWSLIRGGGRALVRLHDEVTFDHTLAMWGVPGGLLARHLRRARGVDYSVWCLGSDIWTYGRIAGLKQVVARVLRGARHCYADGVQLARDAEALSGRSVPFLPSSRSLAGCEHNPASLDGAPPRFLFVGRYAEVKGVDILLEAMRIFVEREGRGSLYMLGGGPWDDRVRSMVETLGLKDRVAVGGYADLPEVVSHALACDAMVIPSRMESIPLVLSDALKLGKPVIVTDVGDMGDLIREVPAGLVVPPADAEALAGAMSEFAARPPGSFADAVSVLAERFELRRVAERIIGDFGG